MTLWQRFLAKPPLLAWAIAVPPVAAVFFMVFGGRSVGVQVAGGFAAGAVWRAIAAAISRRLTGDTPRT